MHKNCPHICKFEETRKKHIADNRWMPINDRESDFHKAGMPPAVVNQIKEI